MAGMTRRSILMAGMAGVLGLTGGSLPLAGCGGTSAGTEQGSAPAASAGPVTIYWSAWGGGERIDQYRDQAARFTRANPNIKVEFVAQSSTNYYEQVTAMLASNTRLDLARLGTEQITGFAARGSLLPLDEFMKNDKTFRKTDYLDGVFVEGHQVIQGKTVSMPSGESPQALFYNPAVWKAAGAPDPNDLEAGGRWTWDAYLSALKQVAKPAADPKVWGGRAYLTGRQLWAFVRMGGGRVLSPDLKTCVLDQPEAVAALEWQLDLVHKHQVAPRLSDTVPGDSFYTGRLGSFISANWEAQTFKVRGFKDFDVAPFPKGPKGRFTTFTPNGLSMTVTTKYKDQTWKLTRYLVDDLEKEYVDSGIFMAFRKDHEDYFLKNFPGPNARWFVEPFKKKEVIGVDGNKHSEAITKIIVAEMNEVHNGNKGVRAAVAEVKRQVDFLLKQT